MEKTYTTAEAAEQLGVSASRVRQIVLDFRAAGRDVGFKRGRDLFFTEADIAVLRDHRNQRLARRGKRKAAPSEE